METPVALTITGIPQRRRRGPGRRVWASDSPVCCFNLSWGIGMECTYVYTYWTENNRSTFISCTITVFHGYCHLHDIWCIYMEVCINGGIQNGWFLLGKIPLKFRWWLGVPLWLRKPPYSIYHFWSVTFELRTKNARAPDSLGVTSWPSQTFKAKRGELARPGELWRWVCLQMF